LAADHLRPGQIRSGYQRRYIHTELRAATTDEIPNAGTFEFLN
jgi:hypothetical protein